MTKKKATKQINKSADDGRFVSDDFLKGHPKTTYKQTVPKPKKAPQKKG